MNLDWEKLCAVASAEVEAMLAALPEPLRLHAEKLPVTFERLPNVEFQAEGIEVDTLGLFTGPEFAAPNYSVPPTREITSHILMLHKRNKEKWFHNILIRAGLINLYCRLGKYSLSRTVRVRVEVKPHEK